MARERVYKVVIDGEEYVSAAAKEAGDGMDRFTKKKDGWIKSFVDLRAAFDTVVQVGRALAGVAMDSLAAFDEYSASMRKLEGTAKVTGTPLADLTDLAAHAKREFGLSSVQANDYATAVNNLATKAGYAGDKQELLAAMLDLGAAKGLTAAESLQAFEQSILGIDEGTDKLFGKNPSGLWADYAEQIGKAPGKMSDLDKSLVLIYATMEAGGKVQGSYSEWLQSSAGQTALLANRLNDAKVSFGEILSPIRAVVVEGMNTFLDSLGSGQESLGQIKAALTLVAENLMGAFLTAWKTMGPAVVFALKAAVAAVMLFSDAVQMMQIVVQEVVGWVAQRLGGLAEKTAGLFRAMGLNVKAEWGTTLRQWGEGLDRGASETYEKFRRTSEAAWASATGDALDSGRATTTAMREVATVATSTARQATQATADSAAARKREEKEAADYVKARMKEIDAEIKVLTDLWKIKTEAVKIFEAAATKALSKDKIMPFREGLIETTKSANAAFDAFKAGLPPLDQSVISAGKLRQQTEKFAEAIVANSRGVLDLAQAFGVVDAQAASVLNSVMNIATALPRAIAGDFGGVAGILGAISNIATQIVGGDRERRALIQRNTDGLARLAREIGGLKLNVTGEDFTKARDILGRLIGTGQIQPGRGAANENDVRAALFGAGLTMSDLEKIAKEFGIEIRSKSGALSVDGLRALAQALTDTPLGKVPTDFASQLEFFRKQQDLTGQTGTASGLQRLLDFLVTSGNVTALQGFDLTQPGARERLLALFESLNADGVAAADLGRLTGTQFRDLIIELIGGLDNLGGTTPAPSGPSAPVEGGETLPPVGAAPTPAATLADVFRDYGAQSLPLLTAQLEVQRGILAATEATATNTALTVEELVMLRQAMTSTQFLDSIDRALADRRRDAEVDGGQGIRL